MYPQRWSTRSCERWSDRRVPGRARKARLVFENWLSWPTAAGMEDGGGGRRSCRQWHRSQSGLQTAGIGGEFAEPFRSPTGSGPIEGVRPILLRSCDPKAQGPSASQACVVESVGGPAHERPSVGFPTAVHPVIGTCPKRKRWIWVGRRPAAVVAQRIIAIIHPLRDVPGSVEQTPSIRLLLHDWMNGISGVEAVPTDGLEVWIGSTLTCRAVGCDGPGEERGLRPCTRGVLPLSLSR